MSAQLSLQGYHHATLTVTDINRSLDFYTGLLGLKVIAELSATRTIVGNDNLVLAISEPPDPGQALENDRFNENRIGLDHLSFAVDSRQEMERARQLLTDAGVTCGEIRDLTPFGFSVMAFRDPDNIQLELSAPL
ncbi:MAG: VOC family protein [Chloroflexota bacterium]|jgi:catechol 2,3-dioxygenase-like lactoylglutathione lyase family enzyme